MKRTFTLLLIIGVALFVACKQRPVLNVYYTDDSDTIVNVDTIINDVVLPVVTTNDVVSLSSAVAICVGAVTDDGGGNILARGVCWSTSNNPTIDDWHTSEGTGVGTFTSYLTNLNAVDVYYIRAYATNEAGTAYGEQKTVPTDIPTGAIEAMYSVSETQKVLFSHGNLQYNTETSIWCFAEHQYDYVGNANNSEDNKWIDLFGWATSGYAHGAICYQPTSTSINNNSYNAYGNSYYNLYDETGQADWGYNAISNGGNVENKWRTMSSIEWDYVLNARNTPSGIRYVLAQIDTIGGVLLLPDNWNSTTYNLNEINNGIASYSSNVISKTDWENIFEDLGAVFLPAAGYRNATSIYNTGLQGRYWTASSNGTNQAKELSFAQNSFNITTTGRARGLSVRLVSNVVH